MCRISGLVTSILSRNEDDVTGQLTGDVFSRKDVRKVGAHFRGERRRSSRRNPTIKTICCVRVD